MKLQDAYVAENTALGTWAVIGYSMPKSTNFTYAEDASTLTVSCTSGKLSTDKTKCEDVIDAETNKVTAAGVVGNATYTEAWTATNNANLNACASGKNWIMAATVAKDASQGTGSTKYTPSISSDDCKSLTPSFEKIGQ